MSDQRRARAARQPNPSSQRSVRSILAMPRCPLSVSLRHTRSRPSVVLVCQCSVCRPAIDVLDVELGLEHALASRRLYTDGAEVLFDYATNAGDTPEGDSARELVVVRNNQRVFSEVVQAYLQRVNFAADGYAQLIRLPQYRAAEVTIDPDHGFGRPRFSRGGASVEDVIDLFRAGEPVDAVADEYGLSRDEVEDAIRVATRAVA